MGGFIGFVSAQDATTGTVTGVGLTMPAIFSVAGSPVTSSGTLAVTLAIQTANTIFAGPTTGAAAAPTFRALVAADIPLTTNQVAFGANSIISSSSALTFSGTLLTITATSEQLRVRYDSSNYYSTTVSSAGAVTFDATGASGAFIFNDALGVGITPLANFHNGGSLGLLNSVSGAGTLTLGAATIYVFSGTTATWSLPTVAGTVADRVYFVKNKGSGILTINVVGGGSTIYTTSAVASLSINPGESYIFSCDQTNWNAM